MLFDLLSSKAIVNCDFIYVRPPLQLVNNCNESQVDLFDIFMQTSAKFPLQSDPCDHYLESSSNGKWKTSGI